MTQMEPEAMGSLASMWWLLAAVGLCLPVCVAVFWKIGRWWVTDRPLPLPLDGAYPAVPYSPWVGVALFLVLQGLSLGVAGVASSVLGAGDSSGLSDAAHFVQIGAQVAALAAGLAILRAFGRGAQRRVCVRAGDVAAGLRLGGVSFAAILPICVAALVVSIAALRLVKGPVQPHPLLVTMQQTREPWVIALIGVEAVVVAPIVEEFLYRGVLLTALLRGAGAIAALVVSSAVFAVVHLTAEPQAVAPLFFLGMALGYVAYLTRSLVAPVIAHALFNALMISGTLLEAGG